MTLAHVFAFIFLFATLYGIWLCLKIREELKPKQFIWQRPPNKPKFKPQFKTIW